MVLIKMDTVYVLTVFTVWSGEKTTEGRRGWGGEKQSNRECM